jgi:hypothetical protein
MTVMKRLSVVLVLLLAVPALAQDAKKQPSEAEIMAMYAEMAQPVAEHKRITDLAGSWKVTTKLWFDPAGQPMTATGTGVAKPILGGRFVQIDTTLAGTPASESMSVVGFDRRTNEYTLVGFDTLGTYYITAAGKYDEAQKSILLSGSYLQPPANVPQKYRFAWKMASADENVLVLYFATPDGKEARVAETTMARVR